MWDYGLIFLQFMCDLRGTII